MTPQKKAIELVEKYGSVDLQPYSEFGDYMIHEAAKQCALIAVEQIETITKHYPPDYMLTVYWNEVKQEIEKL